MTVETTNNSTEPKKQAMRVKFIDKNSPLGDNVPWPVTSAVAFMNNDGNGINIVFKERVNYQPGDVLNIKFSDTYGGENKPLEDA